MVYLFVLFGSLAGICLIVGTRLFWRNRTLRRFVRSMQHRFRSAKERSSALSTEPVSEKPRKSPRISAIELQEVRSLMRSAEKHIAQGQHEQAERLFIQALTIQPGETVIQAELAKLYLATEREAKAEALYKEILLKKQDVSFYANLGLAHYRQGKYIDACHSYQEALNRDPGNPERSASLGRACIAAQRYAEAAPLLEKATERLARNTELLHLLAECYLQIGQTEHAEQTYRRLNRLTPYDETVKQKLTSLRPAPHKESSPS